MLCRRSKPFAAILEIGLAPDAVLAFALDPSLDHHEQIGPERLRAGKSAPDATNQGVGQEQCERRGDEQGQQQEQILRAEFKAEHIGPGRRKVEENSLLRPPGLA